MSLVSLEAVGKTYRGRSGAYEAVRDFSLELAEGEFFCLLGTSGCGKTTVLNMLAGFEAPTAGRITLDGHPVTKPAAERGVVFQGTDSLYDWLTARDNISFGLRLAGVSRAERRATAERYLELVGLAGAAEKHPSELSGGMKQRIQIARALANNPRMLLMDEPFGALDAITRDQLNLDLHRLWLDQRMTTLFVTHSITEAIFLATRIVVFAPRPGRVLEEVAVDLPLPRRLALREEPEFARLARHLRASFEGMGLLREQA